MGFMTKTLELDLILAKIAQKLKSDSAKQQLHQFNPSKEIDEIHQMLDESVDMLSLIQRLGSLPLLPDFDLFSLFNYAKINRDYTLQDLLYIRLFLRMEKELFTYLKEREQLKIHTPHLDIYFQSLTHHQHLLSLIQEKLDEDGLLYNHASVKLNQIRKDQKRFEKQLQDKLQKLLIDYQSYLNEAVIVMRNNRFCLAVKDAFKNKIKGVIHDVSASKQTIYIEPEQTRSITALIEGLNVEETKEIERIIQTISQTVQKEAESLVVNTEVFVHLDLVHAKAAYAQEIDGVKPMINREGTIDLIDAKHPLLDPKKVVPIRIQVDSRKKIVLITGPNTGGKTVALKTIGLLTLMTQVGILTPLQPNSQIAIFDQIFADIGDEQSIIQSLSTFSSHLTKIIQMTETVSDQSLILLDELGSGTDPNEGVALAIAILEYFKAFNVRMVVTTHYSELKSYAFEQAHIQTASVAFDKVTLKPLYRIQMGTTGSSHAFLIASRLGLNQEIVDHAEKLYAGRQTDIAKMMEKLNDELVHLDAEKEILYQTLKDAQLEKETYEKQRHELLKKQETLLTSIRDKEEKKWLLKQKEALSLIEALREKDKLSKPEAAELKHRLKQTDDTGLVIEDQDELLVGDRVYILPYQNYGEIQDIKNGHYMVRFGHFELMFPKKDLQKDKTPAPKKTTVKRHPKPTSVASTKTVKLEVDLRGYRYEEVKPALDDAIDGAMISGLRQLRIIHGFGTGAVRKAVYAYLKTSPYVKEYRYGGEGEGLNGVTIITLK